MLSASHSRLRLLAEILRHVIERTARLAGRARSLPAAERLISGPRAGRCALRTVRVTHAGFDRIEKTLGLVGRAIEASRETILRGIRARDALVDVLYRSNKHEGDEELARPQRMVVRRSRDRRRDEMSVREIAMVELSPTLDDVTSAAQRVDLRDRVFVTRDRGAVNDRSHPVLAMRRIPDG